MGSWTKNMTKRLADRIWNFYDDTDPPILDDEIERAIRETVEEAARRAEFGSCTPHPLGGVCQHQGCAVQRLAAEVVRRMLEDEAEAGGAAEVAGG